MSPLREEESRREEEAASPRPEQVSLAKESDMAEKASRKEEVVMSFRNKIRHRVPRLYYIVAQMILPLLTLIAMAFLFGHFLAKIEMQGEIDRNDEALMNILRHYGKHVAGMEKSRNIVSNTSTQCIARSVGDQALQLIPDLQSTIGDIENCTLSRAREEFPRVLPWIYLFQKNPTLTFDWMRCYEKPSRQIEDISVDAFSRLGFNPKDNHDKQSFWYIYRFLIAFQDTISNDFAERDIIYSFMRKHKSDVGSELSGSLGCQAHTAGGALFWFTIMTTIGYGNTSPETHGGRMLIYTCGFATIIGFFLLNNTAARVWRHLADDLFLRYKMKCLVIGPLSVLFWLGMTLLWMLFIALNTQHYWNSIYGDDLSLQDAFWFSYITTTTVGLGDYHFEHEAFTVSDMFIVPLMVLLGFNFLENFCVKMVETKRYYFPDDYGLQDLLAEQRDEKVHSAQKDQRGENGLSTQGTINTTPPSCLSLIQDMDC